MSTCQPSETDTSPVSMDSEQLREQMSHIVGQVAAFVMFLCFIWFVRAISLTPHTPPPKRG